MCMGVLGASRSFFWGGIFGGNGTLERVLCAIFTIGTTGRGFGFSSTAATLGATCRGANFSCSGTMVLLVVGGLSLVGLGFLVSLGAPLEM